MHILVEPDALVAEGHISSSAAVEMKRRSKQAMTTVAVNGLLFMGIISATFGLIFWLANAISVATFGVGFLAAGLLVLWRGSDLYRMFGNAAALIGAGMLIGGAGFELVDKYRDSAGFAMFLGGIPIAALAMRSFVQGGLTTRFVAGSIMVMGIAFHLAGLAILAEDYQVAGMGRAALMGYVTLLIAGTGWIADIRFITALAIAPFAQMLDTGTAYFHAAYAFYSPESTLTILQMALAIAGLIWIISRTSERTARHARTGLIMAFVVANLAALVGSLWGDVIGQSIWGPTRGQGEDRLEYDSYRAAMDNFKANAWVISELTYSILWALALAIIVFWSASTNRRAIFNASVTFAILHAYTQMFESFGDEPLAYVIGGLAAIPLAWGMWRLNQKLGDAD